jgi:hypothetical protein
MYKKTLFQSKIGKKLYNFFNHIKFILPKKNILKIKAFIRLGIVNFNLDNPITYNEKLNYRKLNYKHDKKIAICSNKFLVRDYISSRIGDKYLIPLLEVTTKLSKESLISLPNSFVAKTTNSSGGNSVFIIRNKNEVNLKKIFRYLENENRRNYSFYSDELWYNQSPKFVIFEKFLFEQNEEFIEFKVYCFNHKNDFDAIIRVIKDRFTKKSSSFYSMDWKNLDIGYNFSSNHSPIERPKILESILSLSKKLSSEFDHVRIDFIMTKNSLYVNEFTFADTSGFINFNDIKWDYYIGNKWRINE